MADTIDSNSKKSNHDSEQVIVVTAEPTKFTIKGEVTAWGFTGEMELDVSQSNNIIKISTLRYKFGGSNRSRNPIFRVICPSQVELTRTPTKDNQWHNWASSEDTHVSKGTTYRFVFIFDAPPPGEGPIISDYTDVTFAIGKPPQ